MKKQKVGLCRLCGATGPLSFEHVPPAKAFNGYPRYLITFFEELAAEQGQPSAGRLEQRGLGDYTLCESCNNRTGSWYGAEYVRWAVDAMQYIERSGEPRLLHARECRPLCIIKQVLTMFCSVEPKTAQLVGRRFLLNRDATGLPPSVRLHMYYTMKGRPRFVPLIYSAGGRDPGMISEIAHPPFGFVLKVDAGAPPDPQMFDISWFADVPYRQRRTVFLRMPMLETASPFPGDYRTSEELERDVAAGRAAMARRNGQ